MFSIYSLFRYVTWQEYLLDQAIYVLASRLNKPAVHVVINELEMNKPNGARKVAFTSDNKTIKIDVKQKPPEENVNSKQIEPVVEESAAVEEIVIWYVNKIFTVYNGHGLKHVTNKYLKKRCLYSFSDDHKFKTFF